MWIVKLALRRPYTFVVMAILMLVLGAAAIASMPTDIFSLHRYPCRKRRLGLYRHVARGIYAKALNALERAVGATLTNNNVTVEDACRGRVR